MKTIRLVDAEKYFQIIILQLLVLYSQRFLTINDSGLCIAEKRVLA